MISLTCTNCQAVLSMDDAFAGGVCRCQHCGTIQTVPSHLKGSANAGGGGTTVGAPKSLYHKGGVSADAGAGGGGDLGELAGAVTGGGGVAAQRGQGQPPAQPNQQQTRQPPPPVDYHTPAGVAPQAGKKGSPVLLLVLLLGGFLLLVVLGVVGYFLFSKGGTPPQIVGPGGGGNTIGPASVDPDAPLPTGPSFGHVPLADVPSVVYVLDRGRSSEEVLDSLKAAVYKSLETIGPQTRFQVIFWDNGQGVVAYPENGLANATPENINAAMAKFEDVLAEGDTTVKGAIEKAVAQNPSVIVLATGKGYFMEKEELPILEQALAGKPIKVHTFVLGNNGRSEVLDTLATKTGGQSHEVSLPQLRRFSD